MIKEMTSLKTLDLTSCEINNKGVIDIMHALPLSNMKCLILSGNKLEPECCKIIGEKLSLSHLEALEVADCGLRIIFIGNAFDFFPTIEIHFGNSKKATTEL